VVIKIENIHGTTREVEYEASAYSRLTGTPGVPYFHSLVIESDYRAMVIDALGPSLEDLFDLCKRKFSSKTVLLIAKQVLARLESLHERNLVYRNVGLKHFLIGCGRIFRNEISLVDLRHVQRYPDSQYPQHDIESACYLLAFLRRGDLPWSGLKSNRQIMEKKRSSIDELPYPLTLCLKYIQSLDFDQKPDYAYLRKIIDDSWVHEGFGDDCKFDWTDKISHLDDGGVGLESYGVAQHCFSSNDVNKQERDIYTLDLELAGIWVEIKKLPPSEIPQLRWTDLTLKHKLLLCKCYDFLQAANHPSMHQRMSGCVNFILKRVIERLLIPLRDNLRDNLPSSGEHLSMFHEFAYHLIARLLERIPTFKATWLEALGVLSGYRMDIETDNNDREAYRNLARYWYTKAAAVCSGEGRIEHHFAVLAHPDVYLQLFYLSKALISVQPFAFAEKGMLRIFAKFEERAGGERGTNPAVEAWRRFVAVHRSLFLRESVTLFYISAKEFLGHFEEYMTLCGPAFCTYGVYLTAINCAAIFEFGADDAKMPPMFRTESSESRGNSLHNVTMCSKMPVCYPTGAHGPKIAGSFDVMSLASHFACSTLDMILQRVGDMHVLPSVHFSLAFIWCMAKVPASMSLIEADVPWARLAIFINALIGPDTDMSEAEWDRFPIQKEGTFQVLHEDFKIRGYCWSQDYEPLVSIAEVTEDEVETPTESEPQELRCLWLTALIASVSGSSFLKCFSEILTESMP
jgi:hypothetical protein